MYGSWTENVVLWRNPNRLFILEGWFWKSVFKKLFNNDDENCSKNYSVN